MEENHMGWKLVKGVRQDVTNLIKLFGNTDSVRYEDFCKIWKEMNFSSIYNNRTSFIEVLEFTEELLQIVKEYLLSVYEFHTRVAALYTLYGLYFKQPVKEAAKIRFTKSEWEEVHSLITRCKTEKHYDVVFIHLKMYLNGAYIFTATVRATGLEKGFRKYFEKKQSSLPDSIDRDLLTRPLISKELVNTLIKLESLYCKKKAELLGKRNLVFIDGKFAKSLQEELKNYACSNNAEEKINEMEVDNISENMDFDEDFTSVPEDPKATENRPEDSEAEDDISNKKTKQKKRIAKYIDIIAKKKAEMYLNKFREEAEQQGEGSSAQTLSFDLPELDSD